MLRLPCLLLLPACFGKKDGTPGDTDDFTCGEGTHAEGTTCVADADSGSDTDTGGEPDTDADSDTGSSAPDYTVCGDGSAPFTSVQDAVDAAADGDTITVCAGTYNEEVSIATDSVSLVAPDGPDSTEIDAIHNDHVLSITSGQGDDTVIRGFTLRYGDTTDDGGGLYISGSSPRVEDCIVRDSHAYNGGGIALVDSDSTLDGVQVLDNDADSHSGAVYTDGGQATLLHLWVEGNSSGLTDVVGTRGYSSYDLSNSVIVDNTVPDGGSILSDGDGGLVYNNVVALNTLGNGANDAAINPGGGTWVNNIVWDNLGGGIWCSSSGTVSYNDVSGNTGDLGDLFSCSDSTNTDADPQFTDGEGHDFTLSALSPCIDAGDPVSGYDDVDGTQNDMGAYGGPAGSW